MELVFREGKYHDLFVEPREDGSVNVVLNSKNGTGKSEYSMSSDEFEMMCKVREMCVKKE